MTKEEYIAHLEQMIKLDGYLDEFGFIPLKEPHRNNIKWLLEGLKFENESGNKEILGNGS